MRILCEGVTKSGLTVAVGETDAILRGEVVVTVNGQAVELYEVSSKQTKEETTYVLVPKVKKSATISVAKVSLPDASVCENLPTEGVDEANLDDLNT